MWHNRIIKKNKITMINVEKSLSLKNNFSKYKECKSLLIKGIKLDSVFKYSIVIPTYKRVSTLKETLESAMDQDYNGEYEIIISDNNPSRDDETEKYISSIMDKRLLYYKHEENLGMTGNLNRCIELASGEYIVFIHDDDILYKNFLTQVSRVFQRYPHIEILAPLRNIWHEASEDMPLQGDISKSFHLEKKYLYHCITDNLFPPTGIVCKKAACMKIGGFNEVMYPSMDYFFNAQATIHANVYVYDMPLSIYRYGINESLKYETHIKWLKVNIPFIKEMLSYYHIPYFIGKAFVHIYSMQMMKCMKKSFSELMDLTFDYSIVELPQTRIREKFDIFIYKTWKRFERLHYKMSCKL